MKNKLNIDKLEIAFNCSNENKDWLSLQDTFENGGFLVVRTNKESDYKNTFEIFGCNSVRIAKLFFGSYNLNRQYIYLLIDNEVLYTTNLKILLQIQEMLNLEFVKISKLDLALDYNSNIINKFYKIYKDKEVNILILNKSINHNTEVNNLLTICKGTRTNITKHKSIYIQNKEKGLTLSIYDKLKEIKDNDFEKQYIIDNLNFNKIYRMEIRTTHSLLYDTLKKVGFSDAYLFYCITNNIQEELYFLFCNLLDRLVRIEYKRKSISVTECL